jgi:multisubunit Na+/H+ antiporter MnhB subunit
MRNELIRRFREAWLMETLNGLVIFPLLYLSVGLNTGTHALSAYGMGVTAFILVTCGYYWRVKSQELSGRPRPRWVQAVYATLRYVILLLLMLIPLFMAATLVLRPHTLQAADIWLTGAFGIFALLEYINYYHLQLMYIDTSANWQYLKEKRRLKPGILARDLFGQETV